MANRAWAIKLGSGGRCVPFCERHGIAGVGWQAIDKRIAATGDRDALFAHLRDAYEKAGEKVSRVQLGQWTGALTRFCHDVELGDIFIYYDPPQKRVQVCEVTSNADYRDFEMNAHDTFGEPVDIWHYRKIRYLCTPIPIVDFFAPLKGKLLGPRGTIWHAHGAHHTLTELSNGTLAHDLLASGPELREAFERLRDLIVRRTQNLDDKGWEWLVADYFRAQHAHVDERVGGTRAVIDIEASFDHGELGETIWHVQVKRYQDAPTERADLENLLSFGGDDAKLCFVSVFGFTEKARTFADENNIRLLEASDFVRFLLGDKVRPELMMKLRLPLAGKGALNLV